MKKYSVIFLGLVALLAMGCPVGLDHPLAVEADGKVDAKLIGTWVAQAEDPEVKRVTLTRGTENTYAVTVEERGTMYALETDKLVAWVTSVGKGDFICLKPDGEEKYYHYQYAFDGRKLITNDVSLLIGGVDAVTSTKALRSEVEASMKEEAWASETISWEQE